MTRTHDVKPLFVLCLGAITNVASAIRKCPEITKRMTAVWIDGQIPNNVYGTMHIGLAEIQQKVYPYGKIGKHLFENMVTFNESKHAGWTAGESWSLGDSPAIGVALEPNCGSFVYREAPIFNEDTSYSFEAGEQWFASIHLLIHVSY